MARPINCRRVGSMPESNYFKPRGIPLSALEEVVLIVDEFETIRLADLESLYQEQAAEKMNVSRQTFGRIIDSAHNKVAEALVKVVRENFEEKGIDLVEEARIPCRVLRKSIEIGYVVPLAWEGSLKS